MEKELKRQKQLNEQLEQEMRTECERIRRRLEEVADMARMAGEGGLGWRDARTEDGLDELVKEMEDVVLGIIGGERGKGVAQRIREIKEKIEIEERKDAAIPAERETGKDEDG